MNQRTLRRLPVAIAVAVTLALSGCGGGSSATKPDESPGMAGGTGGGTGGGTDTLTIGPGFFPSSSAPVYASDTTRLGEKATEWFPPLFSAVMRVYGGGTTQPEAEPAEPFAIRGDGNRGFEFLSLDDGEETTIPVPVHAVEDGGSSIGRRTRKGGGSTSGPTERSVTETMGPRDGGTIATCMSLAASCRNLASPTSVSVSCSV